MTPAGFIPIAQAAPKMGLAIAQAMRHAVTIDGQTVIAEVTMQQIIAERNGLAKAEHRLYSEGKLESGTENTEYARPPCDSSKQGEAGSRHTLTSITNGRTTLPPMHERPLGIGKPLHP